MRPEFRPAPLLIALALCGCTLEGEEIACTTELRINFCVTDRGKAELPAQYRYIRETLYKGSTYRDTLSDRGFGTGNCFGEASGSQRVLAVSGDTVKAQSQWVDPKTVDGCHSEPATVDLTL